MKLILFVLMFSSGCACGIVGGPYPQYASSELRSSDEYRIQRCIDLDEAHVAWTTVSTIGASIATASTTAFPIVITNVSNETDRNNSTIGISIVGIVGSAMVFLGGAMGSTNEQEWNELQCAEFI